MIASSSLWVLCVLVSVCEKMWMCVSVLPLSMDRRSELACLALFVCWPCYLCMLHLADATSNKYLLANKEGGKSLVTGANKTLFTFFFWTITEPAVECVVKRITHSSDKNPRIWLVFTQTSMQLILSAAQKYVSRVTPNTTARAVRWGKLIIFLGIA